MQRGCPDPKVCNIMASWATGGGFRQLFTLFFWVRQCEDSVIMDWNRQAPAEKYFLCGYLGHTKDPKGDHNFDNHLCIHIYIYMHDIFRDR